MNYCPGKRPKRFLQGDGSTKQEGAANPGNATFDVGRLIGISSPEFVQVSPFEATFLAVPAGESSGGDSSLHICRELGAGMRIWPYPGLVGLCEGRHR
jgi:hypothetical protein